MPHAKSGVAAIRSDKEIEVIEIDEMHSYISSKKTTAGYGLLLIDMGKDSSTAYWAIAEQQPANNSGIPSRISKSEK